MFLIESFLSVKDLAIAKKAFDKGSVCALDDLDNYVHLKSTKGHTVANLNTSLFFPTYVYVGCLFKTSA